MGKKSKKTGAKSNPSTHKKRGVPDGLYGRPTGNQIPLYRHLVPEFFKELVDEMNPVLRFESSQTWVCVNDDCLLAPARDEDTGELVSERLKIRTYGKPAECPLCFKDAHAVCSRCNSIFYCGSGEFMH